MISSRILLNTNYGINTGIKSEQCFVQNEIDHLIKAANNRSGEAAVSITNIVGYKCQSGLRSGKGV